RFDRVARRRSLDQTRRARLLRLGLRAAMLLQILLGAAIIILALQGMILRELLPFGVALLISYPIIWAHLVVVPLLAAKYLVVRPKQQKAVAASERLFAEHPAATVAIAGSYGKTTMKELLATVLSEGKKVAATPANKNVAVSHAAFARSLEGDEDILIIEYGEGAPGDVAAFTRTTHPTHAVITGLAPAHLDQYKTLERAAEDIFSVTKAVPVERVYVAGDVATTKPYIRPGFMTYTQRGIGGWKVSNVEVGLQATAFDLSDRKTTLHLRSGLLGRHQVGPLSAAAVLALELGLTPQQVEAGIAKTTAFEHRMKAYKLDGAWIIDDTYNGNLEGIRAGTALLAEVPAARKWYVTPGLVDQGANTANIHKEVGEAIAAACPDIVVLMQNSVTRHIRAGLDAVGYEGEVRIETDPLAFYTNLNQFVASGDVVLMQNDWTDNYA
ncbi:MAG TPA: Mur ligase family protein, partial [Candidatus Limnocylindrales bacterium]|nr:Mur ligase family protein [Candidatus Limnocylindrales bacterium]